MDDAQLLELHRRCRQAIRFVLDGLDESGLRERDPARGYSIAEEVGHLVAAEHYFLADDLGVDPGFPHMDRYKGQNASAAELRERLDLIEERWPQLLSEHPDKRELRYIIARMSLHTLYHMARVVDRRVRMEPDFKLPHWSKPGSWEYAIEPLLDSVEDKDVTQKPDTGEEKKK